VIRAHRGRVGLDVIPLLAEPIISRCGIVHALKW
jgi:hypothetical protein